MSRDAEFDARCRSLLEGREVTPPPMRPGIIAEASPMWNRTRTLVAGALMLVAAGWWFAGADDAAPESVDGPAMAVPMDDPSHGDPADVRTPVAGEEFLDPAAEVAASEVDGVASAAAQEDRTVGRMENAPGQTGAAREEVVAQGAESARMEEVVEAAELEEGAGQSSNPASESAGMEDAAGADEGAAPDAVEESVSGSSAADDAPVDGDRQQTEEEVDSDSPDAPKIRLPLTLPSGGGQR